MEVPAKIPVNNIDLRSDTVTHPSAAMREAMYRAEVGDDVKEEDPTVNRLQEMAAKIMGKEAALLVASGTMGNLISLLGHCQRGEQAIVGDGSHIYLWEQGGASALGGISLRAVPNLKDGRMDLDNIESAINEEDVHYARTRLICLENTWHGRPLNLAYMEQVRKIADKYKLKIHLDGARIFNAAIALKVSPAQLVQYADSVQFCISKGLASPVGSLICSTTKFIQEAKRNRKLLGGGMRQAGILAAAGIVSLESMTERLAEDHHNARLLAEGLARLPEIEIDPSETTTNILFFKLTQANISLHDFVTKLQSRGVLMGVDGPFGIRAVTHYGISEADINEVIKQTRDVCASFAMYQNA